jgi:hypothetical protein
MGFASDTGRIMMLSAENSDIEFQIQSLQQSDMQISNMLMNELPQGTTSQDPDSPQMLNYLSQEAQWNQVSTSLEMRIQQLQAQQKAIQTEIDSVNKVISSDVKDFGLLGNSNSG